MAAAAALCGLAVSPALAPAAIFCVHSPPECGGTSKANLQAALDSAAANGGGRDEIRVGVGLFNDGPAVNVAGSPVDLIGVAANKTAIRTNSTTGGVVILDIEEPTTEVRDLRVHHSSAAPTATGLKLAGDAEDVMVTNQGVAGQFDGVNLINDAASFVNGSVSLVYPENLQNRAIFVSEGASPSIVNSYLEGSVGVSDFGEATVLRTRIRATQGVVTGGGGKTEVLDTEIRVPGPMKSNFQVAALAAAGNGTTELTAERVTAVGDGAGFGTWVVPNGGAGNNASMTLWGSVLDGFGVDVRLSESGGSNASLSSEYSAYDSTKLSLDAGTSHTQGVGKLNLSGVDPRFTDPAGGDLTLLYNSPLVDAGDTGYQPFLGGLDVMLRTRVRDGNGNGVATVDLGAHEYQRRPPKAVATGPATGDPGQALAFDGSESSDLDEEPLTYAWSFDDGTQAVGATPMKSFATPGPHSATLTVTDPAGLKDSATATVTISTPPPAGGGGAGQGSAAALVLSDLKIVPRRFRPIARPDKTTALLLRKARRGTRFKFTLSGPDTPATVTMTVHRVRPKRRLKRVSRFVVPARIGANSVAFSGWGGKGRPKPLKPGRYRLTVQAESLVGTTSDPLRARFVIAPG
jgi:hypothetical protein